MFALVTGTVLLLTVVPTTLLAAQAASSVVLSRMTWLEATTVLTSCAPELLVAVEDLDGNLVIGYAADQDAMSTTLLAEWNVLNAVLPGTRTRKNEFILARKATLINGDAARFLY